MQPCMTKVAAPLQSHLTKGHYIGRRKCLHNSETAFGAWPAKQAPDGQACEVQEFVLFPFLRSQTNKRICLDTCTTSARTCFLTICTLAKCSSCSTPAWLAGYDHLLRSSGTSLVGIFLWMAAGQVRGGYPQVSSLQVSHSISSLDPHICEFGYPKLFGSGQIPKLIREASYPDTPILPASLQPVATVVNQNEHAKLYSTGNLAIQRQVI